MKVIGDQRNNKMNTTKLSKYLSLVLRHEPSKIDLELDDQGWAEVSELLSALAAHGKSTTREQLDHVVETNNKQRFRFSADGTRIRANQGHSINIELGLEPATPPNFLYHGTATRFIASIMEQGLLPGTRQHVHMSEERDTARQVGSRHGKPVILTVKSAEMQRDGFLFTRSENGVWLTENVPVSYLQIPNKTKHHDF